LRFYTGVPILTNDGYAIGTVCIVDTEPREFTDHDQALLKGFAQNSMFEIEQRLKTLTNNPF
jgi:GAF domain-containing protein